MNDEAGVRQSRLSRRDFVVAGGAGLGLSAIAASSTPALSAASVTSWDREADIVVVGSGAAASAAAITAHTAGASVLMLEKAPVLGGTTAKSGGGFWIPNNFRLREKGIDDANVNRLSPSGPGSFDPLSMQARLTGINVEVTASPDEPV
jgi:3-oxosteroid 1-dehydrogenase